MGIHRYVTKRITKPLNHRRKTRLPRLTKIAAAFTLLAVPAAAVRAQSALDGFDPGANSSIRVFVAQPDGKILVGGDFEMIGGGGIGNTPRNHIARLNVDGTVDTTFNPNANGSVKSIVLQADGKILVGGDFNGANSIGGQTRNYIARLDATTGLADSFDPNASGFVNSIAIQADGKILVGGAFNTIGGQMRSKIARLDAMTALADSFSPSPDGIVGPIAVQTDGRILVGGAFQHIGNQPRFGMARLDPTTGLADFFDPSGGVVHCIAVQADGKILAGGFFTTMGGQPRNHIARFDATTGLPDSFNPNANNDVDCIAVQADGKILAGGLFTSIGGQTRKNIARLDAITGLADSLEFSETGSGTVYSIAVQPDGKILFGGQFFGPTRYCIARLEADGRLDQTLNPNPVGSDLLATAIQPDGKILIGGIFSSVLGVPRNNIARLNTDGTLDTAFNPNADNVVISIAVQADGKVIAGGFFTTIGGQARNNIARLNGTTGAADSFDPNANNAVVVIAVQPDGKIVAGGDFTNIGGQPRNRIARLEANSGLADSLDPNANDSVYALATQPDGKILAGGFFSTIGGQTRRRIARLDATTGLADSFDPNGNNVVYAIAVQPDGKILAAGNFTGIGGQTRNRIARLDPTTGAADSFNPNASAYVITVAVQADGKVLAGGGFFGTIGGQPRNGIARLDATTGLADSFNPNSDLVVNSIAVLADGKILVGGNFSTIGGQSRSHFARLTNDSAALQNLAVTQTSVAWTLGGSSPHFARVTFEYSTDNVNYTALGNGAATGNTWGLTGLNLPTGMNFYIRARGYYRSGNENGSESMVESVRNAFFSGPGGSPTPTPTPTTPTPTPTASPLPSATPTPSATPIFTPTASPIPSATLTPTPTPISTSTPTPTISPTATPVATPTPTPSATPSTILGNISTRLRVETGDNVLIGGFIITGTQPKRVIVRAIGPSLPFAGALADPILELRDSSGGLIRANDNWRSDQESEIIATTIPPSNDLESAIVETLPANGSAYTAIVRGVDNGTGVGLIEAYDLDSTVNSKLANISTRGLVQTGNDVMIAGTIVLGQASQRVLVRALGPSLPVSGKLADPTLELRDGNGTLIRANDNWRSDQESEIIATTIPPSNDLESAIVATLPANGAAYTAIVSGTGGSTGVAIVEVYALN